MTEHRAAIQVRYFAESVQYGYRDITDSGASKLAESLADAIVRRAVADTVDLTEYEANEVIGDVTVAEEDAGLRVVDLNLFPDERD